jgi:hypothetical protein
MHRGVLRYVKFSPSLILALQRLQVYDNLAEVSAALRQHFLLLLVGCHCQKSSYSIYILIIILKCGPVG